MNIDINARSSIGKILSTTSTSFPRRFKIRPIGVLSKNVIGLRRMRVNELWKILLDAINDPFAISTDIKTFTAAEIINI